MVRKCENSAISRRRSSHLARNQPLPPPKLRSRRRLIPMVRKTCPPWRPPVLRGVFAKDGRGGRSAPPRNTQHATLPLATDHVPLTNHLSYPQIYQNQNRILKPTVGLTRFSCLMNLCEKKTVPTNNHNGFLNHSKSPFLRGRKKLFL